LWSQPSAPKYVSRVLAGVVYAVVDVNEHGALHCDIKLDNVLVKQGKGEGGQVCTRYLLADYSNVLTMSEASNTTCQNRTNGRL
jgi:hypothetical protein